MDFSMLTEHFTIIVWVACLVVGYCIKHATFLNKLPNNDIPVILALVGAVVNCVVGGFNIESIVYGALTGLASTGAHQAFKSFVESGKAEQVTENE